MPDTGTLRLTLVRAADDEAVFSPGYQSELRLFCSLLRADFGTTRALTFTNEQADGGDGLTGEFTIPIVSIASSSLGAAASAWLLGRTGRTLRLNMGSTEIVANSPDELRGLFNLTMAVSERLAIPATTVR